ncbi:MAG: hypothetical protein KatS3mg008_0561 [Acidimicrobiales bacterium]|nr:MAG: hypothetical protein KatS3mg008_0561 [Acidimicrobiales bacterium]
MSSRPLRIRWLGRVEYEEALDLQRALFARSPDDHLLLLEHPHTFTLGVRGRDDHILVDPDTVGAACHRVDRGGDVTYHGPGQLVGYPILSVPGKRGGGMADTVAFVSSVEELVIRTLRRIGLVDCGRMRGRPGVWVSPASPRPRKIASVGVKLARGRSMHGFALNVDPDLSWFDRIVPCGLRDVEVTSLTREGFDVPMSTVVEVVRDEAASLWAGGRAWDFTGVSWPSQLAVRARRLAVRADVSASGSSLGDGGPRLLEARMGEAGVGAGMAFGERKPEWLKVRWTTRGEFNRVASTLAARSLHTVCEEAGCPNRSECWAAGTATFLINGDRCTRACGFCLVDTRKPLPLDPAEPGRVAEAARQLGLEYVVLTSPARDDLADGGASGFAACIAAVRSALPGARVEVLIPDFRGDRRALATVLDAAPDVVNHNVECVPRLQRAVRPSADYARSLALLARCAERGLVTKSGLMVGLGETFDEVVATMADLRSVGVGIVTVGQYLRPSRRHLPVRRWWTPEEFDELRRAGEDLGIPHVEAGPLVRSSFHAERAAESVGVVAARAVRAVEADVNDAFA